MPIIERWIWDADLASAETDLNSVEIVSNDNVAVSMYSLLGFDDSTLSKSIPNIPSSRSSFPKANVFRTGVNAFPGWARWTNRSHVVKLGMLWTFPVNVSGRIASLHLSVEPRILWRYVDLYNYQDFSQELFNKDFYLMASSSTIGPNTLWLLNNVSYSRIQTAMDNLPPVKLVVETPTKGSADTSETSNIKLAWLNMSDNTWVVLCNTTVAVSTRYSSYQLQATAYVKTSLFFDFTRNSPDPYSTSLLQNSQYAATDPWSKTLDLSTLSYFPLGFSSNYSLGGNGSSGPYTYTQRQFKDADCITCDKRLQGGRPCDGCGGRFEVFNYSGCYVADGSASTQPETWTVVSKSSSPYVGRKVIGCDARIVPVCFPTSTTGSCSPLGFQQKVVLQPGRGFRAFIDRGTFSVTVGVGLCVTPTPNANLFSTQLIPDLTMPQGNAYPVLCSALMRLYYDSEPSMSILLSVPIKNQSGSKAIAWYSVSSNQWNPFCTKLPISENSIWLDVPVNVLTNPDFINGAKGCADVTLRTRNARCDGFGASIACLMTSACNGFTPACSSPGLCLQSLSDTVQRFDGNVSIFGSFAGTTALWVDSFASVNMDTWTLQITKTWDTAFLVASGLPIKGAVIMNSPVVSVRFSATPSSPLVVAVNLQSFPTFRQTRVLKLAWYNRSRDALFWTPICNSIVNVFDGFVSATLDLDLLTSPDFGNWSSDLTCGPILGTCGTIIQGPPSRACQTAALLVVVTTPWSFCNQGAELNDTSPGQLSSLITGQTLLEMHLQCQQVTSRASSISSADSAFLPW